MPIISRVLFPVLSCFGPLFMVVGLQSPNRSPVNNAMAMGGALMVAGAFIIVYLALIKFSLNKSN